MSEFIDDTVYPLEASTSGSNAHCVHCSTGYSGNYAVCLHKIACVKRGAPTSNPDCDTAIKNRTCEAIHMREKEVEAGHALFFIDRAKQRAFYDEIAAQKAPVRKAPSVPAIKPTQPRHEPLEFVDDKLVRPVRPAQPMTVKHVTDKQTDVPYEENGYAAAINAAIKEATAGQPNPMKPTEKLEPVKQAEKPEQSETSMPANMSPLEAARLRMRQRQTTN